MVNTQQIEQIRDLIARYADEDESAAEMVGNLDAELDERRRLNEGYSEDDGHLGETFFHASQAVVRLNRVQSSKPQSLFGTSVRSRSFISLTVERASLSRTTNHDFIHGERQLLTVCLSQNQLASLITSMGEGTGTPCTLARIYGDTVPEPKENEHRRDQFKREFEEKVAEITRRMAEIADQVRTQLDAPGTLKKAQRTELSEQIMMLLQEVQANLPYLHRQFDRSMDEVASSYAQEVEANLYHLAQRMGISNLGEMAEQARQIAGPGKAGTDGPDEDGAKD